MRSKGPCDLLARVWRCQYGFVTSCVTINKLFALNEFMYEALMTSFIISLKLTYCRCDFSIAQSDHNVIIMIIFTDKYRKLYDLVSKRVEEAIMKIES